MTTKKKVGKPNTKVAAESTEIIVSPQPGDWLIEVFHAGFDSWKTVWGGFIKADWEDQFPRGQLTASFPPSTIEFCVEILRTQKENCEWPNIHPIRLRNTTTGEILPGEALGLG